MSGWFVIITGVMYAVVAIEQGMKGNIPVLIMYGAYAVSNIGIYMLLK